MGAIDFSFTSDDSSEGIPMGTL